MNTISQQNSETQLLSSQAMDASSSASDSDSSRQSILLTSPYTKTSKESDSKGEDLKHSSDGLSSKKRPLPEDFDSSIYKEGSSLVEVVDEDDILNKKPGRKPMTEDLFDDDEDPKIKRKAQNRAAQRAFRERKERYVKELEKKIKLVQDSHMLATAQLFQENQQLKSVIYRLELENFALKGIPVNIMDLPEIPVKEAISNFNWLSTSIQQPTRSALPTLAPIQIRPSPLSTGSSPPSHHVSILPQQKKAKISQKSEITDKKSGGLTSATEGQNVDSNQQFTFSISTPDTLRASAKSGNSQSAEKIQMVHLYPDHSHPANQHFENKSTQPKSVGTITPILSPATVSSPASVASYRSDGYSVTSEVESNRKRGEEEDSSLDALLFGQATEENKLGKLLEPLFNTSEEFDIDSLISNQTSMFK